MNNALLILFLFSASSFAVAFDDLNEVVWQSQAITVSKNSVIPVPEECTNKSRVEFAETSRTDTLNSDNGMLFLKVNFSANKSPDGKYWVIDSVVECKNDSYQCITNKLLMYKPETQAIVSCMKYRGMTIRLGENGEPIFESDIPEQQEAIKKAEQRMVNQ